MNKLVAYYCLAAAIVPACAAQDTPAPEPAAPDQEQTSSAAAPGDWPQWRGPHRDAMSGETGLLHVWPQQGPSLVWNQKGIGSGYSGVVVSGGKIFTLGDRDGGEFAFALDEKSGKRIWAARIGATWGGDGPRCTPTIDGDRVYAITPHGDLVCLAAEDGQLLWRKNFAKDFGGHMMSGWGYSESPLVDGEKLLCTPGADRAALVALNKRTGKVLWKAAVPNCGGAGYSSIVVSEAAGIRQYITILGPSGGVVGVEANKGKLLWQYKRIVNGTANIPTPLVNNDMVFCSTGYGAGAALLQLQATRDGGIKAKEVYYLQGNKLQNHHGGMVWLGDHIYGGHGHNDGHPFCLNVKDGSFAWSPVRGPGQGSAAVIFADNCLYFRYQDNVMALIEATPESYHLLSHFNLPGNLGTGWAHPAIAHGRLYIRGADQLLCFDVKGGSASRR